MNLFQKSILMLAPLSPYLTNLPVPDDTVSHWSVGVAAGIGKMADVSRTCEGNVISVENYQYSDVAVAVRYTDEPLTVSLSGGTSTAWMEHIQYDPMQPSAVGPNLQTKAVPYCVPMVGIDTKYIGLEVGWLTTFGQAAPLSLGPHYDLEENGFPAGSIRLGNRAKAHFSAGIARNFPLIAGGGLIDLGVARPIGEKGSQLFFGFGALPYDGIIFSLKADLNLSDRFTLVPRLGVKGGDAFEYGLSIGGRVRF